jgi:hypothetical protein
VRKINPSAEVINLTDARHMPKSAQWGSASVLRLVRLWNKGTKGKCGKLTGGRGYGEITD